MLAFALAVWACGLAGTLGQLIGWRFVQGMAGGLMIPVGQAAAFNLFQDLSAPGSPRWSWRWR